MSNINYEELIERLADSAISKGLDYVTKDASEDKATQEQNNNGQQPAQSTTDNTQEKTTENSNKDDSTTIDLAEEVAMNVVADVVVDTVEDVALGACTAGVGEVAAPVLNTVTDIAIGYAIHQFMKKPDDTSPNTSASDVSNQYSSMIEESDTLDMDSSNDTGLDEEDCQSLSYTI